MNRRSARVREMERYADQMERAAESILRVLGETEEQATMSEQEKTAAAEGQPPNGEDRHEEKLPAPRPRLTPLVPTSLEEAWRFATMISKSALAPKGYDRAEDIVVATKIRMVGEGVARPAFGVRFATKLPNASNESGLGLDTADVHASVLVAKTVQSVRTVGNVGLGILGYMLYERQNRQVLKIDVPGFQGEIPKDRGGGGVDIEVGKDR